MINKEILVELDNYIEKIKREINRLEIIIKEIRKSKKWKKHFYHMYDKGYLDQKEYNRLNNKINEKIKLLNNRKYKILYNLLEYLNEANKMISFLKTMEQKTEDENTKIEQYYNQYTNFQNKIDQYFPKIFKNNRIYLDKKYFEAQDVLFKKNKKEKKEKIKLKIYRKTENVDYFNELKLLIFDISFKIFGKLSSYILDRNHRLYYRLKSYMSQTYYNISPEAFVSFFIFIIFIIFISLLLITIYLENIIFFFYGLFFIFVITIIPYYYLEYRKNSIKHDIDRNLPFVIIHMASLAEAGIEPKEIFKLIAETEEYRYLSKEIGKIIERINIGESLTDALKSVAEETPSKELKDFLEEFILTIRSGRKISEFLMLYSTQEMIRYNNLLKKEGQAAKTFSDLYVGMVLTLPMIILSIGVMLMSIIQQTYNTNISGLLDLMVYVGLPLINIGFIVAFSKISSE
ncbi:archaeal flagellar protein FlaJ [Nanobdella aerobiophila]|uniref:Archaeal flagellar protein FlaJ n=1 Tax=Nanobdella aerobiophila TaxID=2586965 RepID=A0A915SYJ8_9ARCH|nr:type II secretion system F family protein [Nanobdella aerobiophila]BBL45875.1 archaeal flagellar protein FlaJ [Nanobdella aerobiophila]